MELCGLPETFKSVLGKGRIHTIADLLSSSPQEVAQKCNLPPLKAKQIIDLVLTNATLPTIQCLEDVMQDGDEKFTTGDRHLDNALGGGIRTSMVWELVGESAAGKTQLALQLSLFIQLPLEHGGLSGSTCYITTSSKLSTSRLMQISQSHPMLSSSSCGLEEVHTISTPTTSILIRVLSQTLPSFIHQRTLDPHSKSVKLVVVDALAELFHTSDRTTTRTLVERSKDIAEVSTLLHALATTHRIAVLVLNEVVDAFDHGPASISGESDLVYNDQSRWFSGANSVPGENRKEASLGLVWVNQVNARILLSRTGRRRYLDSTDNRPPKRHKSECHSSHSFGVASSASDHSTVIRRLSIIFSSVSHPTSLDYVVTEAGVSVLPDDNSTPTNQRTLSGISMPVEQVAPVISATNGDLLSQISPLDVGIAEHGRSAADDAENIRDTEPEEDEWAKYWDANEIPADVYNSINV